ncbi:unnamed protein product [Schistocephalus solidus]|uniref:Reverse transcriptase domain-containing protein n=1 Tax=Schistocephalus solidus TaxID=70667 RepID=A0A183SQ26_SCHSO|nr:unnamed protein product [Schistocephalus solidus]
MLSVLLMDAYREERPGIRIICMGVWRMRAPTTTVHDLHFADDRAFSTAMEEDVQNSIDPFAACCVKYGRPNHWLCTNYP